MNVLVCVKRVPATGGRINLTADGPRHRHEVPRLRRQPARGVRGRGGGPDRRGPRRHVRRHDAGPGSGRPISSATRWRSASIARSCSRPTARDWDPVATAAALVEAIRALEAAGGPFDLILFGNESADSGGFQVGIRVAAALDRPIVTGAKGLEIGSRDRDGPTRGARRLGDVRGAVAGGRRGSRGHQPAAIPVGPWSDASEEEGDRARGAVEGPRRTGADPVRLPQETEGHAEILGTGPEAAAAVVAMFRQIGVL